MFWRLLRSDWLKWKRSVLSWTAVWIPVGYALVLAAYVASRPTSNELVAASYRGFIEGWSVLLPMILGLWSGLMGLQEEQAGQFAGMLGAGVPRSHIFAGKWSFLAFMTIAGTYLAVILFLASCSLFADVNLNTWGLYLAGAGNVCLGSLVLVAIHLFLSFAAGFGATIGMGAAGSLMAVIIGSTVIGDAIWRWFPWAWGTRLPQLSGLWMTMGKMEPSVSFLRVQWREGIALSVVAAMVSVAGSLVWFQRWEGRKSGD